MILDKKFRGILDAGAGCLIIYEDQAADGTYDQARGPTNTRPATTLHDHYTPTPHNHTTTPPSCRRHLRRPPLAQALETLGNMGRVVDALYDKAQKLGVTSQSLQSVAAKA